MTEATSREGGCHCGAVRYRTTVDLMQPAITCNCSICQKTGGMLSFVTTDAFTLLAGEADLTDYQFAKKRIHHLFCKHCGVRSFATGTGRDGSTMYAINVRCLDGIDLDDVPTKKMNGRSL